MGVLKFGGGEGVVPLHPLDAAFSDSVGPSLAARLTFRQDNTIADRPMLQLMASLDHILATARHSCGAGGIGAGMEMGVLRLRIRTDKCASGPRFVWRCS